MLEAKEKQIGEHRYEVTQLAFGDGRRMLLRLAKVLGPSLREIERAASAAGGSLDAADALPAIASLVDRLTDEDLDHAEEVFGKTTRVKVHGAGEWKPLSAVKELVWGGRYQDFLAWLGFAVEVNFAGFFAGAFASVRAASPAAAEAKSPSTSPPTSTGSSGVS